jgi:N,N'-diacetyllegionaminate synthase
MTIKEFLTSSNPFFIAEIGLNHNGHFAEAEEMILKAAGCGAHAVKFQTFLPELMNSPFTKSLLESGKDETRDYGVIDFLSKFTFTEEEYRLLKKRAVEKGLIFFSAPFDVPSVELLERLEVPLYKAASSEITNLPLLKKIGRTGKPVLLSTGMADENEIDSAVKTLESEGSGEIILLHCVSLYPLEPYEANLKRIGSLKERFNKRIGISDHSPGTDSALIASALGASVFEKHFKLSSSHDCPDKDVSVTPEEFTTLIEKVKSAAEMTGNGKINPEGRELNTARGARRSLFAAEDISADSAIEEKHIALLRPGCGIPADKIYDIAGRKAVVDIKKGSLIKYTDIS